MYKKILVPTDVSGPSRNALLTALELARQFGSEIELFHVTPTPQEFVGYSTEYAVYVAPETIAEAAQAALEAALKDIAPGEVQVKKKYASGHPATAILEEIKTGFDLVVMGSRGHGPFTGGVIGSVSLRVLAHAECPVLIVR